MAPSVQITQYNGIHNNDCGPLPCEDSHRATNTQVPRSPDADGRKVCCEVERGNGSKSSPRLRGLSFDQDLPDTQIAKSTPPTAFIDGRRLEKLLLDTQEISQTNRTNTVDEKDASVISSVGSDSQLPDTQTNATRSPYTQNSDSDHLDYFLPDTQTNTPESMSPVLPPPVKSVPNPQLKSFANQDSLLPDTQCDVDGTMGISIIINTSIQNDKDLPDTQFSSGAKLGSSESDDLLLPDTQCNTQFNTGGLPKISSTTDAAIQHIQDDKELTNTQVSSVAQPESSTSGPASSVQTCPGHKSPLVRPPPPKQPFNKVTCRERKRIIVSSNRPPALTKAMCQWVDKTNYLLDPFREDNECWFHPSPPSAHLSMNGILRPCGKLQKRFNWQDRIGKHSIVLNYGIVSKLVNYKMTKQQKDGFINKQWHLSHLCGNWICLNPAHTTVEPGHINISRNNCFSHRSGCFHNPLCMKDKKVSLGVDGKPVDHNASIVSDMTPNAGGDWDDWSILGFDDGDASTTMGDLEDSESIAFRNDDEDFLFLKQ